jgi:integrase/recombinase XerD
MPVKDSRTAVHVVSGNPQDPHGMYAAVTHYFASLGRQNYAVVTIDKKRDHLNHFIHWGIERDIVQPKQITLTVLETYLRRLQGERNGRGKPRSYHDQYGRLVTLRAWMTWLVKHEWLPFSPAERLAAPKLPRKLPRHVLTASEAEAVLQQPDVNTPLGLRDRAMLEVLYSTGIRRMELGRLRECDLDFDRGVVAVLEGKGRQDRVVPIGRRALGWVQKYLDRVRPQLDQGFGRLELFLTSGGR